MKEAGVRHIEVTTALNPGHEPAQRMYEKFGFKPLHDSRRYYLDAGT